ncbi:MAG TPA: hypothetical protein PLJ60_06040 [Chryseolinea sp.]|nr:hypothetical protein [Chryseolinea sp.]HPH46504.1 hypothetical protein [Chryseolinea sp.]HPM29878.1 hypothetical protein [Chryseolinea sp.]
MKFTKKFTLLLPILLISSFALAQTVKVKKENARIKGENVEGFEIELDGEYADVNAAFVKYLKGIGKVKQSGDELTVNEPTLENTNYGMPVFGTTKEKGKNTSAWIGIKTSEWPSENVGKVNKELEKQLYEFGVKFYKDKIQLQVDESLRASLAVEKQQQKLVNQNKELTTKLEDNKREKIQLDKSIEKNALEYETLLQKIEKNKHDQDSVALAGEQIKKVMEMHKARQSKVN